jgi:predicted component of type VI protein secretion system
MGIAPLALVVLIASAAAAEANCADDMTNIRLKVVRAQQVNPNPQSTAAAKELKRYDEHARSEDEVSCYNTIARIQRALNALASLGNAKPGEPVGQPVEAITSMPPR